MNEFNTVLNSVKQAQAQTAAAPETAWVASLSSVNAWPCDLWIPLGQASSWDVCLGRLVQLCSQWAGVRRATAADIRNKTRGDLCQIYQELTTFLTIQQRRLLPTPGQFSAFAATQMGKHFAKVCDVFVESPRLVRLPSEKVATIGKRVWSYPEALP